MKEMFEGDKMNVGELKKFLKNIPDNTLITVTAPTTGYFNIEDATYERSGFYPMGLVQLYINDRQNCPFRHEDGNCLAIGGFCLSVPDKVCKAKKDRL